MVQRVKLNSLVNPSGYSQDSMFLYCLLNSSHKLMLMKIFRAVVEFLMNTVFTSLWSFPCGLTFHSQLKRFEKQSLKIPILISIYIYRYYIHIYMCLSIQYNILLCIIIRSAFWSQVHKTRLLLSQFKKSLQIYCFFVSESPHITFMLSLLCLVRLLFQTDLKKQVRKWSVLSCYFYEDDQLNACSGTLLISTHINRIKQIT